MGLDGVADVRSGTQSDAKWFSIAANQGHGLQRKEGDIRRAVLAALEHPNAAEMSLRKIAEYVGCGHNLVAEIRNEKKVSVPGLQIETRNVTRTGPDGKRQTYKQNTARIGKGKAASIERQAAVGIVAGRGRATSGLEG